MNDTVYPPQRKSFSIIRYFHDVELNNYDWFVRADDDVFIEYEKMEIFLSKLDPNLPYYIGQPGYGVGVELYILISYNKIGSFQMLKNLKQIINY